MSFLPDDYKVPSKADGYMKLQQGDNKIRIMTQPILGWEWWVREDGTIKSKTDSPKPGDHPMRVKQDGAVPLDAAETVKHFWAMVVWNYEVKQFQILELTQKGIQRTITSYTRDEDWGDPSGYDIVITKTGEKMETEYEVKAKPQKELDSEVTAAFKNVNIELEALYQGADPFSANEQVETEEEDPSKDEEYALS